MKFSEALFRTPNISIFRVLSDWEERLEVEYTDWELEPISAPTLSAAAAGGRLDGLFILKGSIVISPGKTEQAYLGITLPEGVSDDIYILENDHVSQRSLAEWGVPRVVPAVAIEEAISEQIYYSRVDPEVGLEVLRRGLDRAKDKCSIARIMATILRCEKRYPEAEEAYSVAIAACPEHRLYYNYSDRALVREAIGDAAGAISDREEAEKLTRKMRRTK